MNCIVVDDEQASRMVITDYVRRTSSLNLMAECENAKQALEILKEAPIDVVFLDIEMPKMSGIEMLKSLNSMPQIVLTTGRKDFAAEAYEYGVTFYLVKPVEYPLFLKAVHKVQDNLNKQILETQGNNDIYIKADGRIVRLKLDEIMFIEALSDYVIINMQDNKKHIVHATMKSIERRLSAIDFVRVHRSYIVNIHKIDTIEDIGIIMPQKTIPIGASYKNDFLARLNFL